MLPRDILLELPPDSLAKLPADLLRTFPTEILEQFSDEALLQLPIPVLQKLSQSAQERARIFVNSIGMVLRQVPDGEFVMGEGTEQHRVRMKQPFFMGVVEVTQLEYLRTMGAEGPSQLRGWMNPVENVTWQEAVTFCKTLSAKEEERVAGRVYRLPTEAEWEYACRAGTTTQYSFGDDATKLDDYGWQKKDGGTHHPVGTKAPNAWGFFDMHGNVWEWCHDSYSPFNVDQSITLENPVVDATANSQDRVFRGGGAYDAAEYHRSSYRHRGSTSFKSGNLGLRVVCELPLRLRLNP
jgi:formylglycine-generating enzyme required for sulfatase activity